MTVILHSNFAHLEEHDKQLLRLGLLAERYFADDPNTSLLKLRQLTELLAQHVASRIGLYVSAEEPPVRVDPPPAGSGHPVSRHRPTLRRSPPGRQRRQPCAGRRPPYRAGCLKISWQLGVWFHRTFKDSGFKSGPFIPPQPPVGESGDLHSELDRLSQELATYRAAHHEAAQQLESMEAKLRAANDEQTFWEQLAARGRERQGRSCCTNWRRCQAAISDPAQSNHRRLRDGSQQPLPQRCTWTRPRRAS